MNWYRVKTPHDAFAVGDMVLLEGGLREAVLEQWGYLELVRVAEDPDEVPPGPSEPTPEFKGLEPSTKDEAVAVKRSATVKRKRVSSGESFEAGSPESEPVVAVSGDESRGEDRPSD